MKTRFETLTSLTHFANSDPSIRLALAESLPNIFPPPVWISFLFLIVSNFSSGGLPSITNTSLTRNSVNLSKRRRRFLKCGLLTCWQRCFAWSASHIQKLKSTQSVLLVRSDSVCLSFIGSKMFQSCLTPMITSFRRIQAESGWENHRLSAQNLNKNDTAPVGYYCVTVTPDDPYQTRVSVTENIPLHSEYFFLSYSCSDGFFPSELRLMERYSNAKK